MTTKRVKSLKKAESSLAKSLFGPQDKALCNPLEGLNCSWYCSPQMGCLAKFVMMFQTVLYTALVAGISYCVCDTGAWIASLNPACCICSLGCWNLVINVFMSIFIGYAAWSVWIASPTSAVAQKARACGLKFYYIYQFVSVLFTFFFFWDHSLSFAFLAQLYMSLMSVFMAWSFAQVDACAGYIMSIISLWSILQAYCASQLLCANQVGGHVAGMTSGWFGLRSVLSTVKHGVMGGSRWLVSRVLG